MKASQTLKMAFPWAPGAWRAYPGSSRPQGQVLGSELRLCLGLWGFKGGFGFGVLGILGLGLGFKGFGF